VGEYATARDAYTLLLHIVPEQIKPKVVDKNTVNNVNIMEATCHLHRKLSKRQFKNNSS
jgi:hypothetical protein